MRVGAWVRGGLLLAILGIGLAAPAEARRFRVPIFHSGGGDVGGTGSEETIERVRDLPDTPAFRKDGDYLDVGYLYRHEKRRGTVVSEDRAGGFYVLYHGDSYVRLDPAMRSLLVSQLGYDPVAGHDRLASRMAKATAGPTPIPSADDRAAAARAARDWSGDNSTSNIPGDPAPKRSQGGFGFALVMLFLLLTVGVLLIRAQVRRAAKAIAPLLDPRGEDPDRPAPGRDGFEARVAARMAELSTRGPEPAVPSPPAPPVRTFGRRVA